MEGRTHSLQNSFGLSRCSSMAIFAQRIEKVKLANFTLVGCRRSLQSLSGARIFILLARCRGFDVDRRQTGREVEVADQIDIAPGDGRCAFEDFDGFQVACCQLLFVYPREEHGVVVDDRVGDQPGAFVPDLLLRL